MAFHAPRDTASGTVTSVASADSSITVTNPTTTVDLAVVFSPAVTVANEGTDTTCFPLFATAATGNLAPKSNANLTYNSNTGLFSSTLISATTSVTSATIRASSNDSGSLGASGTAFSDLFLASGAVIDFNAGNWVATHTAGILTVGTGDLRVTTAGTNSASVVTVGGTQTLTAKTLTTPTIDGATANGDFQMDATPNTDDTFNGRSTNTLNAGATIAQWDVVYLSSSSTWLLTDADAAATAGGVMVAMATEAGTNGNPMRVALPGTFVRNDAWNWTPGAPLYIDTATPGAMTATAPSGTDDVVRIVAYAVTADVIFWNPSNDWITIV